MSIFNTQDFNVSEFKPETLTIFRKMCSEQKEFLEYLSKFGNVFEKAAADLVLKVGGGSS
jgi:hypothetical protein